MTHEQFRKQCEDAVARFADDAYRAEVSAVRQFVKQTVAGAIGSAVTLGLHDLITFVMGMLR